MVGADGRVSNWTCKKDFCVNMRYDDQLQWDHVNTAQILYEELAEGSKEIKPIELRHYNFGRKADDTIYIGPTNNFIVPINCDKY